MNAVAAAFSFGATMPGSENRPKISSAGKSETPTQPVMTMPNSSAYIAQCTTCDSVFCQGSSVGSSGGAPLARRQPRRATRMNIRMKPASLWPE